MADARMTAFCYETLKPLLVEKYGDDPDKAYRSRKVSRQHAKDKEFFDSLAPTVDEIDESNPFYGCNVCFTGKMLTLTRKAAWQETVNLGAIPQKSVTKKTDYLVLGSFDFSSGLKGNKSTKLKRAEQLLAENGLPEIVSEDFFIQFLEQ